MTLILFALSLHALRKISLVLVPPLRFATKCNEHLACLEQNMALNTHYQSIYLGMAQGQSFTQPRFHHLSEAFLV